MVKADSRVERQRAWRSVALAAIVAVHVGGLLALREWSRPKPPPEPTGSRLQVLLLPPDPPSSMAPPQSVEADVPRDSAKRPMRVTAIPANPVDPTGSEPEPEEVVPQPHTLAQRLFRDDGSLVMAEQLLQHTDANTGLGRVFEYQIAGLEQAGKILERPQALVYEATRFDGYWRPTHDVLTDLLIKAVEVSTATVRIPIPGRPGWNLVCSVVVLAVSGGCGMVGPDHDMSMLDDPDTLSAEEQRACAMLWDRLAGARTQQQRIELRRLYETGCRKPPARLNGAAVAGHLTSGG